MIINHYLGSSAFSSFRLQQLLQKLQRIQPRIQRINVYYYHLVLLKYPLSPEEGVKLHQLLTYGEEAQVLASPSVIVMPRQGTESPWGSKATDIAHHCGLTNIERIERGRYIFWQVEGAPLTEEEKKQCVSICYDPLVEEVLSTIEETYGLFEPLAYENLASIPLLKAGKQALVEANRVLGLALSDIEIDYLMKVHERLQRDFTAAELMMFAQANSEHCRHKIFRAAWWIDHVAQDHSLFAMIRYTHQCSPNNVLSAYKDNACVVVGGKGERFYSDPNTKVYQKHAEDIAILLKVETHNHPTAIAPFPGAGTGAGGEIRDEGATGRGAKPKAGLVGFAVSHLMIPNFEQPWEITPGKPAHLASSLQIMLEGPIGAAAYNNEFGRPNLGGYFRTFCQQITTTQGEEWRGYHKPLMIAGGIGNIKLSHVEKKSLTPGDLIIVLGGPAFAIGLGGGAASSMTTGNNIKTLDFASVQRQNPEMERRCQEVIDHCWALEDHNPILSIHDVGAGGLSNAIPEIVHDWGYGAHIQLQAIPTAEPSMSPLAVWCNESQERYIIAISPQELPCFTTIAQRERCPFAVVGEVIEEPWLRLEDKRFTNYVIDFPLETLFGKMPQAIREYHTHEIKQEPLDLAEISLKEAIDRVLRLPAVASKHFLITIGDRSVSGLVARDQMIGPWQVPVADVAITCRDYTTYGGEAMAMGERAPIALINPAASGRMAIAEVITNLCAAPINQLSDIKLSANWMAAADHPGENQSLFTTVKAVAQAFCPALGIAIPVGKDSLSMQTRWQEKGIDQVVTAPLTLVATGVAPIDNVRYTPTSLLITHSPSVLLFIDAAKGKQRLGGSAIAQVFNQLGNEAPDVDDPLNLINFFKAIQALHTQGWLWAYHDRSDGGLFTTLCEIAFANHLGLDIKLNSNDVFAALFNEEIGAVIQIPQAQYSAVQALLNQYDLAENTKQIATLNAEGNIRIINHDSVIFKATRKELQQAWSETSYAIQRLRDNPDCAQAEFDQIVDETDQGLSVNLTFDFTDNIAAPFIKRGIKPKVAILREQGVNGQLEMAAAFTQAGFTALDVPMNDLLLDPSLLQDCVGLAACGGFSYGDVLGAGEGWAKSILYNEQLKTLFAEFFARQDTFALGICNGCQMMANIKEIIPGTSHWPRFIRNLSEQYEARFCQVKVEESPSWFFTGMAGSTIPIMVAHGEGRVHWADVKNQQACQDQGLVTLRYVDSQGQVTETFPANPNGSVGGITGLCSQEGKVTLLMPHPERIFRLSQWPWVPEEWRSQPELEYGPWMRLFWNVRKRYD